MIQYSYSIRGGIGVRWGRSGVFVLFVFAKKYFLGPGSGVADLEVGTLSYWFISMKSEPNFGSVGVAGGDVARRKLLTGSRLKAKCGEQRLTCMDCQVP